MRRESRVIGKTVSQIGRSLRTRGVRETLRRAHRRVSVYAHPSVVGNYLNFRCNPWAHRLEAELPGDRRQLRRQLEQLGAPIDSFVIDVADFRSWLGRHPFPAWYRLGYGDFFVEKALEHYLSATLLGLCQQDTFIDVAAANSPWTEMATATYGCEGYALDLSYRAGVHGHEIGADATRMPLPSGFATKMALHCAYEVFEGDSDTAFIREAARVLRPGGRLVIVPLYLGGQHYVLRGPLANTAGLKNTDVGAPVYYRSDFGTTRFARFYDVDALYHRVLRHVPVDALSPRILAIENAEAVDAGCYVRWVALLERR